jgi:hypothetical protein
LLGPCGGVVEVEAAGAVECLLRGADGVSAGQEAVLVAIAAGEVDRESPVVGRAAVAQPAQRQDFAVGEVGVEVGELAVEAHGDVG